MDKAQVKENILRTLLYYDIFSHPLKPEEIFIFLPKNSVSKSQIIDMIRDFSLENENSFAESEGYVYVKPNEHYIQLRKKKEKCSRRMWRMARFMTHIIKRFPFVRGVFISGSLSKNSSEEISDIDFMVVTKKGRLWISRTLLMLFKKIFLLNSYKYFCLNYFITEDNLEIPFKNVFTATEVAYIKSTFNSGLMRSFVLANKWIKEYFPNYEFLDPYLHSSGYEVNNRKSYLQKIWELPFLFKATDKLDDYLRVKTSGHWKKKYNKVHEQERSIMFRTAQNVSTAHPGNMQKTILTKYCEKLKKFNLECDIHV
jgi:predicted nucleotidyltransferase